MHGRIQRILKHGWQGVKMTRRTISPTLLHKLTQAVAASEQQHSGQIRICVEADLPMSYLWRKAATRQLTRQRALMLFGKLRVWDTEHNNGVLIYLLLAERAIEVVADRGLNILVEPQHWQTMVAHMSAAFKAGRFEEGLTDALAQVSALLIEHFALAPGETNSNELPDTPLLR